MSENTSVVLAIVGGSALEELDEGIKITSHKVKTPYGDPSCDIVEKDFDGRRVFFLSRHGKTHNLNPSEVNYRANVYALKSLGVTDVVAVSSVGILKEGIRPSEVILPDQVFDRTSKRESSFFEKGIVAHVSCADSFCESMRSFFKKTVEQCGYKVWDGGTLVCIEGPVYSTRAESLFYKNVLQASCVGMTALPETKLFREAGICFVTCAMTTDYDCWKQDEKNVSSDMVVTTGIKNTKIVKEILSLFIKNYPRVRPRCSCEDSLKHALVTKDISDEVKNRLGPILKDRV